MSAQPFDSSILTDSAGAVDFITNVLQSSTEHSIIGKDLDRKNRIVEQLNATQLYRRLLIESNIDALMTTNPLGIVGDVNQQMEALTGRTREGRVTNYELTALAKWRLSSTLGPWRAL